jgi:hypothetical protein
MAKNSVQETLQQAAQGLVFVSETDAEFEAFQWPGGSTPDSKTIKTLSGQNYDDDTLVEETALDSFFRAVPAGSKKKFQQLSQTLKDNLEGVRVYKIGDTEKDVYIVGKAKDGTWAGLKTQVVET